MGLLQRMFGRKADVETRASGSGFTAAVLEARAAYIAGASGLGELTGTVSSCVNAWEGAMALADVDGTTLLDRRSLALAGRTLALRGEAVFLIRDEALIPATAWDLSTRDSRPHAYRLQLPEAGGPRSETALAAEVLHFRIGADAAMPWLGVPPLRRSSLSAALLHVLEAALGEVYENSPLGSQVLPLPEMPEAERSVMQRSFRGARGRVLLRESINVSAAGGPTPAVDWRASGLTPDLTGSQALPALAAARGSILAAFGVLPAMMDQQATGPLIREAQRHLAMWTLQPAAALMAEEATAKLGVEVSIDTLRPLQAFDVSGRARSLATIIGALAEAKAAGLTAAEIDTAATLVNWGRDDGAA